MVYVRAKSHAHRIETVAVTRLSLQFSLALSCTTLSSSSWLYAVLMISTRSQQRDGLNVKIGSLTTS